MYISVSRSGGSPTHFERGNKNDSPSMYTKKKKKRKIHHTKGTQHVKQRDKYEIV